ncbi:hypothetical protein BCU70_05835 [Vibrio sp. 10N.286.49.C2]|uniref:glycosyltransferase family 4 protein n=1 Tax=unclassified Vibrio TaxID=2614977 RepID=UPI000C821062|nr:MULTISPECIES: glycosyltransferase family 4 protein [unclassified Vibrio]PMH31424.1 hypothetical protein BCU70_05835 [Vibrio sp. 10N.286.49.C2]PMH50445.1 hypothetical protein BCU66_18195 [Vibrio sp. 10N.286.49.B1]PMH78072.1 hypothetical protein BCU58_11120 [Vibrio sp. 10N.286.48.B7]
MIWLVLDSSGFGGIETHVVELAKGLISHGQQVNVVLLSDYGERSAVVDKLDQNDVPHMVLSTHYPDQPQWSHIGLAIKAAQLDGNGPTTIHSHGYKANILCRLTKLRHRSFKITYVASFHAGETPTGRVKIYDWIDRYSSLMNHERIAVSQLILNKLPLSSRARFINNFVPVPNEDNSKKDSNKTQNVSIGFVGRLSEEKDPQRFLSIAKHCHFAQFNIYGDGPMREALINHASNNVVFHGQQSQMNTVWPTIDILLITSQFEGLPMAALEAMSRGIPVISFPLGQLPELITTGSSGWIVDTSEEMILQVNHWMTLSQQQRRSICQAARERIKHAYSTDVVVPQFISLYQRLIK